MLMFVKSTIFYILHTNLDSLISTKCLATEPCQAKMGSDHENPEHGIR